MVLYPDQREAIEKRIEEIRQRLADPLLRPDTEECGRLREEQCGLQRRLEESPPDAGRP